MKVILNIAKFTPITITLRHLFEEYLKYFDSYVYSIISGNIPGHDTRKLGTRFSKLI